MLLCSGLSVCLSCVRRGGGVIGAKPIEMSFGTWTRETMQWPRRARLSIHAGHCRCKAGQPGHWSISVCDG